VGATPHVIVCGAGLTGLATAWQLQRAGCRVTVLEAGDAVGGVVRTTLRDGYLVEQGPNSCMLTPELALLIDAIGLTPSVRQAAPQAQRRFIVRNGTPIVVPTSPPAMLRSPLFSLRGKLRILAEPFIAKRSASGDESVAAFVRRRLGDEPLTWAVDPFVSGVYAGDPAQLSVSHAFPRLAALEREHGSLLRGAIAMGRKSRVANGRPGLTSSRATMVSFERGMQQLPDAIAAALGSDIVQLRSRVIAIDRANDECMVRVVRDGVADLLTADAVVSTLPLHALQQVALRDAPAHASATLASLPYPPVSSLALGFRRDDVRHALDGFGCLIPGAERRRILGVLFSSTLFEQRAPAEHVLLTCFLGGVRQHDIGLLPTAPLLELALPELRELLGVAGAPTFVHHTTWPHAIPQYNVGHDAFAAAAGEIERAIPGLIVDGQFRRGVSVGDCIASGETLARRARGVADVAATSAPAGSRSAPPADARIALPPATVA
jgi:protoporphyrinogen/coproporphyrinogen III oxidase